jgi:hypothetical protein
MTDFFKVHKNLILQIKPWEHKSSPLVFTQFLTIGYTDFNHNPCKRQPPKKSHKNNTQKKIKGLALTITLKPFQRYKTPNFFSSAYPVSNSPEKP